VVLIPEKNVKDLVDLPKRARADVKIVPVKHMDEVAELALLPDPAIEPPRPRRRPGQEEQPEPQEEE
jgi:ATP-dependent Lon protease